MAEDLAEKIMQHIDQAAALYYRLILVVAPARTGKTAVLQEVHRRTLTPLINVNLELSRSLLDLTERQRALQVPRLLAAIVNANSPEVVLLDNIELLFDISLRQDPLRLLQMLARNMTVVAAWNGTVVNGQLVYATPEHNEYRRYSTHDLLIVNLETTT